MQLTEIVLSLLVSTYLPFTLAGYVEHKIGGLSGSIKSQNYPDTYPAFLNVSWKINVRWGFVVQLYFTEFDIENSYDVDMGGACVYDYVEIMDGDQLLHKYCGNSSVNQFDAPRILRNIRSTANILIINLVSDYSNEEPFPKGFSAHWKEIDRDECWELKVKAQKAVNWDEILYCNQHCHNVPSTYYCSCDTGFKLHKNKHTCTSDCAGKILTESEGEITTSRYPEEYSKLAECNWTIKQREGISIELQFVGTFGIEEHVDDGCVYDWVQYEDAYEVKSERFCGSNLPAKGEWIFTNSHLIKVFFNSDLTLEDSGFKLRYNTTRVACFRKPVAPSNGKITSVIKDYVFEDLVTFVCNIGYRLNGNSTIECLSTGSWSDAEPKCERKYHEFQVANSLGNKWKAEVKKLYHNIILSMSVEIPEFWRFEREEDKPLWSFHVFSEKGEKLYLSYDENSKDITLNLKDDSDFGKKRLFVALVQENETYLFRAHNTNNTYITSDENGKLEMITTELPLEKMRWFVKENLTELESSQNQLVVEISHLNRKWISGNARTDSQVSVQQNSKAELWNMKTNPGKWTFSPFAESSLFASSTTAIANAVLFEGQVGSSDLAEYKPDGSSSYKLQNLYSKSWVSATDGPDSTLNLQSEKKLAVSWDISVSAFSYTRLSKTFFFPPLRVACFKKPVAPSNGKITSVIKDYVFEDLVTFVCNIGYRLNGNSTIECLSTGNWSDAEPKCERKYHEFQVANSLGKKWKAEVKKLYHNITLSMSVGMPEFWRFEREEDKPLWSFHVISEKEEKLYLSYDENSKDITLNLKDDSDCGKKRLFVALVQENETYLFRAHNTNNTYITSDENGKLEMNTTEHPLEYMRWFVKENLTELESSQNQLVVEIMHLSRKWISGNPRTNSQVRVRQNSINELWNMTTNSGKWMFSPFTNFSLFASSTTETNAVLFEGKLGSSDLAEYNPKPDDMGSHRLQNRNSSRWVSVTGNGPDSTLNLQSEKTLAVPWDIKVFSFSYMRLNKTFFFPPLRMLKTIEKHVA